MSDRRMEWEELHSRLEHPPVELEYVVQRASARQKKRCRFNLRCGISLGSLIGCFSAFVLMINFLPSFAYACGKVPLLKELAKAVAWSQSLSAAVENEYVQNIGQEQSKNGITIRMEYVIVDQKQVNVFYTLDADQSFFPLEANPQIYHLDGSELSGYSLQFGSLSEQTNEIQSFTADFIDTQVPDGMQVVMNIYARKSQEEATIENAQQDMLAEADEEPVKEPLASVRFYLEFDPHYTEQGTTLPISQTFQMDEQTLTLRTADIYPTHMRLNFDFASENSSWLKGLEFYLENENGERFDTIQNGISATGEPGSPAMVSYWANSDFFSNSQHLTMYITRATWLEKSMEKVRIDLKNNTAETLPSGVKLLNAEKKKNGWIVSFLAHRHSENSFYQVWDWSYYGGDGVTEYSLSSGSTLTDGSYWDADKNAYEAIPDGYFLVELPLVDYTEDTVWLCPAFTDISQQETPVRIIIK